MEDCEDCVRERQAGHKTLKRRDDETAVGSEDRQVKSQREERISSGQGSKAPRQGRA